MKQTPKRHRKKPVTKKKPAQKIWLSPRILRRIEQEAAALRMSPHDYLRLMLAVTGMIQKGLSGAGQVDGDTLLALLENPLFPTMVQWMTQMVANGGTPDQQDDTPDTQSTQEPKQTQPMTVRPVPGFIHPTPNAPHPEPRPNAPFHPQAPYQDPYVPYTFF